MTIQLQTRSGEYFLVLLLLLLVATSTSLSAQASSTAAEIIPVSSDKVKMVKTVGSPPLMVVDMGRSYKLSSVKLKLRHYTKGKIYLFATPPPSGKSWGDMVAAAGLAGILAPYPSSATVDNATGRYLVIVYPSDPEDTSDLLLTGYPFDAGSEGAGTASASNGQGAFGQGSFGGGGGGSGESPIPGNQFNPPVPPASP